jgi:hypothetical protein
VIAHLNAHDSHHQAATAYRRDAAGERLLIHSLNLAEVLIGGVKVQRGQEMLSDMHAIGIGVADRTEGEALRLAHLRVECGLKLPGCWALDTAPDHQVHPGHLRRRLGQGRPHAARHGRT